MIYLETARVDRLLDELLTKYPEAEGDKKLILATMIATLSAVGNYNLFEELFHDQDDVALRARVNTEYLTRWLHGEPQ